MNGSGHESAGWRCSRHKRRRRCTCQVMLRTVRWQRPSRMSWRDLTPKQQPWRYPPLPTKQQWQPRFFGDALTVTANPCLLLVIVTWSMLFLTLVLNNSNLSYQIELFFSMFLFITSSTVSMITEQTIKRTSRIGGNDSKNFKHWRQDYHLLPAQTIIFWVSCELRMLVTP